MEYIKQFIMLVSVCSVSSYVVYKPIHIVDNEENNNFKLYVKKYNERYDTDDKELQQIYLTIHKVLNQSLCDVGSMLSTAANIACNRHAFDPTTMDREELMFFGICAHTEIVSYSIPLLADIGTIPIQVGCDSWVDQRIEIYEHLKDTDGSFTHILDKRPRRSFEDVKPPNKRSKRGIIGKISSKFLSKTATKLIRQIRPTNVVKVVRKNSQKIHDMLFIGPKRRVVSSITLGAIEADLNARGKSYYESLDLGERMFEISKKYKAIPDKTVQLIDRSKFYSLSKEGKNELVYKTVKKYGSALD